MKKNINKFLIYYLFILFVFGTFYLYEKHTVGNDSTISEWIINYSGGFTKRGIIGHLCIYFAEALSLNLRESILIFQISILCTYFVVLYYFFKDLEVNKLILLSIFTPIFILYPIAEIEVLARKEIFIFCLYILYLNIKNNFFRTFYKITFLPLAVLIWEPVIFFFPFWLSIDLFNENIFKPNLKFFKNLIIYIPAVVVAIFIAFNPMTIENHNAMSLYLKTNFNEICYMSCALLKDKSTIYDQFAANFSGYSFPIFLRYFLVILIGFGPFFTLNYYSMINNNNKIIFFNNFNNFLSPILILLSPTIILFAMGSDWGRWVNISYTFSVLFYFSLYKKNIIKFNNKLFKNSFILLLDNKKFFIIVFIIFCFGWNPKTSYTGDVGSKPAYQIPRKAIKIIYYKYIKNNY